MAAIIKRILVEPKRSLAPLSTRDYLAAVAAAGLLLSTGLATGVWTGRWKTPEDLGRAAAKMTRIPKDIGAWHGEDLTLDERQRARAQLTGYVMRRYRQQADGTEVTVLLMCGRPGPLAAHTPDVCFDGAGYELSAPLTQYAPPAAAGRAPAEFTLGDFRGTESAVPTRLDVLWAWSADGHWSAPDRPRVAFAASPVLYKLYLTLQMPPGGRLEEDPRAAFVPLLLAEIDRAVFNPG